LLPKPFPQFSIRMESEKPVQKLFNPWNPSNKIIPKEEVERILKKYGWKGSITNVKPFQQACVHKSYVDRSEEWSQSGEKWTVAERPSNCLPLREADNEELEFIGDGFVGNNIGLYLARRYKGEGEGFFTRIRTRIVNNNMLGKLAKKIGLAPWLIVSRHVENVCQGRENLGILGSMFEAWLGALFEHEDNEEGKGDVAVRNFLIQVVERHIDFVDLITDDTNYKDQLLRLFQSQYHQPPRYKEVEVVGPPHDRIFTMGVLDPAGNVIATATARNKQVAEQEASRFALAKLNGGDL
jgi:ribonuclease-3